MGIPAARETLSERATLIRDSLKKSQSNTEGMVTILGSFDHRLSALDAAMRPTQVRTHGVRRATENIDRTLKSVDRILLKFDIYRQAENRLQRGPHEDLESYMEAISQLRSCCDFFQQNISFKCSDAMLNQVNSMLTRGISKLEEEFRQLLSTHSQPVERDYLFECLPQSLRPSQQDDVNGNSPGHHSKQEGHDAGKGFYKLPTLISPRILPLLHKLAQQLFHAGRQAQCSKIYCEIRTSALDQSLRKLGVERFSADDVQKMQWKTLEAKIANWIHYLRISVKVLFVGEQNVCNQIFEGFDHLGEQSFAEVASGSIRILLGLGDAVTKCSKSPEKLFTILDMYEIMLELEPEIGKIFEGKACTGIRASALSLKKQLAQTIQETLSFFRDSIEKDSIKSIFSNGKVHPLTSYVINHLKYMLEYQSSLKMLAQEFGTEGGLDTQPETLTLGIIQALLTNLDLKSKQYKDQALTHLFLMNNIHYIVTSVRKSEAHDFLGNDWVQVHRRIVQQNANLYKRVAWTKVLQSLSIQAAGSSSGTNERDGASSGASRETVKDRFRSFNSQFEELHQKQSEWVVPDIELRESLKLMINEVLQPAYRSFLKRFAPMIENSRNADRFIKYTLEDLDRMLSDFFEGKTTNDQKR